MLEIECFGHVNIVVSDLEEAKKYYSELMEAKTVFTFTHFKNEGFSKNLGFDHAVDVSLSLLALPHCPLQIECIQYHDSPGQKQAYRASIEDLGGVKAIELQVSDIHKALHFLREREDLEILNQQDFIPMGLGKIAPDQFELINQDPKENEAFLPLLENQKLFYFRDRYGIIWALEERIFDED